MQFSRNSTHPTQSNVKVHSMSTLTGPHDQKIGFEKRPPPFATLWILVMQETTKRWKEKWAKSTTRELDCVFQQHSLTKGRGRGRVPCPPLESYTCMHDGRATVQQDTLVSIGNRCHTTFHLHLHTGREKIEMRVFWSSVPMVKGGGGEVKTKNL